MLCDAATAVVLTMPATCPSPFSQVPPAAALPHLVRNLVKQLRHLIRQPGSGALPGGCATACATACLPHEAAPTAGCPTGTGAGAGSGLFTRAKQCSAGLRQIRKVGGRKGRLDVRQAAPAVQQLPKQCRAVGLHLGCAPAGAGGQGRTRRSAVHGHACSGGAWTLCLQEQQAGQVDSNPLPRTM